MSAETGILLSALMPRDSFIIRSVRVGREVGRRLADMGFTEGTDGVVVRRGGFGGPMQVCIRGYDLLIRKDEAARIEVDLVASDRVYSGQRGRGRVCRGRGRRRWFGARPDFD
ncbi:MAG: hypothetical protein A2Y38_09900 [Spirochaetes bacterium GWB1_59_5]|nr:MAG: hypothetical protein A2Y38_09900 [Spirochaetes bacterium GWB1_59_5]